MLGFPRRVLGGALVCVAILGALGLNVEDDLAPTSLAMPGSESARAEAQLKRYFGDAAPFAVLLRGPAPELDHQGPALIRTLRRTPGVTTLSPWDRGAVQGLRPGSRRALILVDFHVGIGEAVSHEVPYLDRVLEEEISPPVVATESSYPSFERGLKDATNDAAQRAQVIVVPVLLLVLLLVFRSPLAAAVPVLLGTGTVIAARGILAVLSNWLSIDAFALPVSAMIGLALGVDYTLLMVSRFREELTAGKTPLQAAYETRRTAGRTVLVAGSTLFVSVLISLLFVPGPLFASLIGSLLLVTALSVLIALVVGPAVLILLGDNVNRWRVGPAQDNTARWMGLVSRALKRPGVTAAAISLPMLIFALPALSLAIGPAGPEQLPRDSEVRRDAAQISRFVGPGWSAPFSVIASTEQGSITDPRRFAAISRWQKQLAADSNVQVVIGPSRIVNRAARLRKSGNELVDEEGGGRLGRLRRLGSNLDRAATGVSRLRGGLVRASAGAGLLGEGSRRAEAGANAIADGLRRASEGGRRAAAAAARMESGTRRLVKGQRSARFGALQIELGMNDLLPIVGKGGVGQARSLRADLLRKASKYPELEDDVDRAARLVLQFARAKSEVKRLKRLSTKLHTGLGTLAEGGEKLRRGTGILSRASHRFEGGLQKLGHGSDQLAGGLSRLSGGAEVLEGKLAEGARGSYPLQTGLRRAGVRVSTESRTLDRRVDRLRNDSPGFFDSGNFVLTALDGTPPKQRHGIEQIVDLNGGQAVRMLVVSRYPLNSPGSNALYDELRQSAAELARSADAQVGVTGGGAQLSDFGDATAHRFPLAAASITVATFLMLVVLLRALLLPAIAVLLNLASVAVAFGVLALIAQIPAGYPLGGHSILDVTGATAVFSVAFGLSIDYAVFLVMRMRESYQRDGDHARAIAFGIENTARVISGAAAVMAAVFLAFASVPVAILSQMGVGLAVAVLLDATVVRILLLPALMLLAGERVWKLPRWLDRALPTFGEPIENERRVN